MKILEIIPALTPCGVTRYVVDLCNELARGYEVLLVVFLPRRLHDTFSNALNPEIKILECEKRLGIDISLPAKLHRIFYTEKPDIIHIHTSSALQYSLMSILFSRRARFFYTVHSEARFETPSRFIRFVDNFLLFRTERCRPVANARFVAESWAKEYHTEIPIIPVARKLTPSMLVDPAAESEMRAFRVTPHTKLLLCVGNLTPVKNQLMLCEVTKRLCREGEDICLVMIGVDSDKAYAEKVKQLCDDRIHWLGPRNNPLPYMRYADVFCLCSHTESGPLVLLEAMYAGLIPVCTPCGDVRNKIIDGGNGFISDEITSDSYYHILKKSLSFSNDKIVEMRNNILKELELYAIENVSRDYEKLFLINFLSKK